MQKKNAILLIMDINGIIYNGINYEMESFIDALSNTINSLESNSEIIMVLTDFKNNNTSATIKEYGRELIRFLNNVRIFSYPYTKADSNINISNISSKEIEYLNSRHKYSFIQNIISKINKDYNVVYTTLMQDINLFNTNEEFQAKEQIEAINKICKFDLLFNSSAENDLKNVYNDHLVVSGINGLKGYAHSLNVKIGIDKGVVPNMRYHEFYSKNKSNKNNNTKIENNSKDMLIIIDASMLDECNLITGEFDETLEAKKDKIGADNLYIVVTNKTPNSHTKEDLERIARDFKWPLGNRAKIFTKTNIKDVIYETEYLNSESQGFLKHATEIRNMFSKQHKIIPIHTLYFTHANNYKSINNDIKQEMSNSNIEFLAHSADKNIDGVICSKMSGFMSLNDCIKLSIDENSYVDNNPENKITNNEEITVFYCDIAGTIDYINFNKDMIETLNDKLIELKQVHDSNKIMLCLITNDSDLNYLNSYVKELKNKLDPSIIFTNHFYVDGALINGELVQEDGCFGYNKFGKIKYHLNKLINSGYKINYVYFADDNMDEDDVFSFDEYLPNEIKGRLLIPNNNCNIIEDKIIPAEAENIYGLIDCINKSIELENQIEKGTAYSKQYIPKTTIEDDDDDVLPF